MKENGLDPGRQPNFARLDTDDANRFSVPLVTFDQLEEPLLRLIELEQGDPLVYRADL